jgi:hypothetical protein
MSDARPRALMLTALVACLPSIARAQKDLASCKPVLDALDKQYAVPYHAYGTTVTASGKSTPRQNEMISAGGQLYIRIDGGWRRSPMTVAMLIQQQHENVRDARALSCRRIRDESVGGVDAVVYGMHSENDGSTSDGQVWIARSTSLPLRLESDVDPGDPDTTHISSRIEYTNVQPPAVSTGR